MRIQGNTRRTGKGANIVESAALSASALCLIHCLALPVLLMAVPGMIGLFVESEAFHYVALALVLPTALAAFWIGYRRHRVAGPALLGAAGAGFLAIALAPSASEISETWLTVAGSLLLIAGHAMNWRLRAHAR